jgi:hypothetical protein
MFSVKFSSKEHAPKKNMNQNCEIAEICSRFFENNWMNPFYDKKNTKRGIA